MNKIIKYLIRGITMQKKLIKSNVKLQTKIELMEIYCERLNQNLNALNQVVVLMDTSRVNDNLKMNQYTKDIADTLSIIKAWINEHEGE